MKKHLEYLDDNDVISNNGLCLSQKLATLLKVKEFIQSRSNGLGSSDLRINTRLLYEGVVCEILQVKGGGWRKGK